MAITTLSGVLDNISMVGSQDVYLNKANTSTLVAGQPCSLMYSVGTPAVWTAPSPGVAGAALTSYAGQMAVPPAGSGLNTYLSRFTGLSSQQAGMILLCDRLWHNSGLNVTLTTAQTINSPTWPSRDSDGATAGRGVFLGLEVTTATSTGTPVITCSYTNSAGTAGQSGVNVVATTAAARVGAFFPIGLAAGDVGVRSVQSLTFNATWTSGAVSLVAYRILGALDLRAPMTPNAQDPLNTGMARVYDNSVPFMIFVPQGGTGSQICASVGYAQG